MTLPASGQLSMADIHAEFGLGYSLNSYRGVEWWTDANGHGYFSAGQIGMDDFHGKRATNPVTPGEYWYDTAGSHNFTVPTLFNNFYIELWGGGGAAFQEGSGNGGATTLASSSLSAGGGSGGAQSGGGGGSGGVGANGNQYNYTGGTGSGKTGGSCPNGGAGGGQDQDGGFPGGGGGVYTAFPEAGAGGGGGNTRNLWTQGQISGSQSITVGAGGAGGGKGGSGATGRAHVWWN